MSLPLRLWIVGRPASLARPPISVRKKVHHFCPLSPSWCGLRGSRRGTVSPLELRQVMRQDDESGASAAMTGGVDSRQLASLYPRTNFVRADAEQARQLVRRETARGWGGMQGESLTHGRPP